MDEDRRKLLAGLTGIGALGGTGFVLFSGSDSGTDNRGPDSDGRFGRGGDGINPGGNRGQTPTPQPGTDPTTNETGDDGQPSTQRPERGVGGTFPEKVEMPYAQFVPSGIPVDGQGYTISFTQKRKIGSVATSFKQETFNTLMNEAYHIAVSYGFSPDKMALVDYVCTFDSHEVIFGYFSRSAAEEALKSVGYTKKTLSSGGETYEYWKNGNVIAIAVKQLIIGTTTDKMWGGASGTERIAMISGAATNTQQQQAVMDDPVLARTVDGLADPHRATIWRHEPLNGGNPQEGIIASANCHGLQWRFGEDTTQVRVVMSFAEQARPSALETWMRNGSTFAGYRNVSVEELGPARAVGRAEIPTVEFTVPENY